MADSKVRKDDIIQIIDDAHPWYPCLLIVDEVKSWGVQAGCIVPNSNDGQKKPGVAYNRISTGQFVVVGEAIVMLGSEE